ncbi:MAG TPA: transporter substrate-binding domain-containing protein [Thiobacillaceae bacterium]|nr:transporter substrate-binding domain-containing protein [Thiobacillaceae bacterium]
MYGRLLLLIRFALPLVIGFWAVICLLAMLATNTQSWAAEPAESEAVQIVGLVPAPPFAMKDSEGKWEGIAVDLWRHVAHDLGLRFELQEMAIPDLVAGLQQSKLIAVVTATASADRELLMEFSHPYYSSGLAIAVPVKASSGNWFEPLGDVVSAGTVKITSVLLGLLLIAAVLIWLSERQANPEHFSPQPLRGIADGLWWAAVTLTTVGYGDKAPRTRAGRVIGVIWMFAAVVLIALFTAQVTSSLTVTSLSGRVRGPADLVHVKVGAIQDSQPQTLLQTKFGVKAAGYPGFRQGLEALEKGDISAFVAAEPVLRYEIANNFPGRLAVVGAPFLRADYVFAFPLGSAIRKQVNRSILSYIETNEWRDLIHQYLGSTS